MAERLHQRAWGWVRGGGRNLKPGDFPELSWKVEEVATSLKTVFEYATRQADDASQWYLAKKGPAKWGGWFLRGAAIVATAVAGVIPVLGSIYPAGDRLHVHPGWASIAVAVAVLLVALDKLLGFTSAWVRFILAAQEIKTELEVFRFDWQLAKLRWSLKKEKIEDVPALLELAKAFVVKLQDIVGRETQEWAAEFQSVIKQFDQSARQAQQALEEARAELQAVAEALQVPPEPQDTED